MTFLKEDQYLLSPRLGGDDGTQCGPVYNTMSNISAIDRNIKQEAEGPAVDAQTYPFSIDGDKCVIDGDSQRDRRGTGS